MKIIVIALLLIVAPASAEWPSRRTGRERTTARSRSPDDRSEENSPTGRVLTVVLSRKLTPGRFGISYRIDNRPLRERILQINPALDSIMFMDDLRQISNSRTMQVATFPCS